MNLLFSPFKGIFHWKYVLTPVALPIYDMGDGLVQQKLLIFGFRVGVLDKVNLTP